MIRVPSNLLVLFDRPLATFTNNINYIDCPNNGKTRLEVVCKIFCFLKITSFTHHTTILRLIYLSYRGKNDKKSCLKYSIQCCFPMYFPASFLSRLMSGTQTQALTWCQCLHLEYVSIETMAPEKLDKVLSKFYAEVKKKGRRWLRARIP